MDPKELLEYIARNLVDDPDAVAVTQDEAEGRTILRLTVAGDDVGKVIGRGGRTVKAIRDVMRAAGTKDGRMTVVEIAG
jgi:uncharacterized protein